MSHTPASLKIKCPVCLTELDVPGITVSPAIAAEMLRALEAVTGASEESDYLTQVQIHQMCRSAIKKARNEK